MPVLVGTLLAMLLSSPGVAANLSLYSNAPSSEPLVITPLDTTTPLVISLQNETVSDPPSEFLTAWQLRLEIVADAEATGTLAFAGGAKPVNYVFDGTANLGLSVANSGNRLFAQDFNVPDTGGVEVPAAPGANLLSITFALSPDARGRFGIFALAGLTNSEWTDAASPLRQRRTFGNVPDEGGPVQIADVLVASPGDFNLDGSVGAADYVVWRNGVGGEYSSSEYDLWVANFGHTAEGTSATAGAVPEPAAMWLIAVGVCSCVAAARRRRDASCLACSFCAQDRADACATEVVLNRMRSMTRPSELRRTCSRSLFVAVVAAVLADGPSATAELPQLRVSENRRYLVDEDNRPFFYLGDTACELFHRTTREEADSYLEDRASKGFTVIQAVALAEEDGLNTPNTYDHRPLADNDPATPLVQRGSDNAYWDHVDYVVNKAESVGMYIELDGLARVEPLCDLVDDVGDERSRHLPGAGFFGVHSCPPVSPSSRRSSCRRSMARVYRFLADSG